MSRIEAQKAAVERGFHPFVNAFAITPADATNLQQNGEDVILKGLYVGTPGATGTVVGKVYTPNGTAATVTFTGLQAGTILPIAFAQIDSTGTDASDLVGLL